MTILCLILLAAQQTPEKKPFPSPGQLLSDRQDGVLRIPLLPPRPGNPRNSEGDFIRLKDGRLLFVYTHFTGGTADDAAAHLASRISGDGGRTWSGEDEMAVPREGTRNVMSVSLRRLRDGSIALFYLRKNSPTDCRPVLRTSADEARTWGPPKVCIEDEVGYYVLNNDRVAQLSGGRLVMPVARHHTPEQAKYDPAATLLCYLSDDDGKTWRRGKDQLSARTPEGKRVVTQEPGVVELKDGRLLMFCRTNAGCQYVSRSGDGGETWTPLEPSSILSPLSPAGIERIPKTGDLLLVWNNHDGVDPKLRGKRTPFTVAISRDDGRTWEKAKTLEDHPAGWYCYTAVEFVDEDVILGHCAGITTLCSGLAHTQISRFSLEWLYR